MGEGVIRSVRVPGGRTIFFRLLLFLLLAAPASAFEASDLRAGACTATTTSATADPARLTYQCDAHIAASDHWVWLRLDPARVAALPPRFDVLIGQTRMAQLAMVTIRANGKSERSVIDAENVASGQWSYGGLFRFMVRGGPKVTAVYIGFDRPVNLTAMRRFEAVTPIALRNEQLRWVLVVGLFIGSVGASLIGSLFFYRAVRGSSHLWYAGWAIAILAFGIYRSNVVFLASPLTDSNAVVRGCLIFFAAATSASLILFNTYIEPGVLSRAFRRWSATLAIAGMSAAGISILDHWLDPFPAVVASSLLILVQLATIFVGVVIALRQSSRAVWFYAIAWVLPLCGLVASIAGYFAPIGSSSAIDLTTLVALGLQAILLFVGQADRFSILQREHREAVGEQAILRRLAEVVFQISNDGLWTFLNPAWEEMTGETVAGTLGRPFASYLNREDAPAIAEGVAALKRGEISEYRGHARYAGRDGSVRWVSLRVHLRHDDDGKIIGTGGSFHDITERHLSALALEASEQRYRALAENSLAGIHQSSPNWRVRYVNPAYRAISGLTAEQALGYGWLDAVRADHRKEIHDQLPAQRASPARVPLSRTICFVHPDGTERWGMNAMTPIFADDGTVTGYAGVTLDITEQHLSREALLASEARFKALSRLSPAVIFRTDPRGYCTFINAAWTTLTGRSPSDALGFGYLEAVDAVDRERVADRWRIIAANDINEPVEYRFRHRNGSLRWTTIAIARETEPDGTLTGFVGVVTEITAQKMLEHELQAARTAAEHAATTDELTGLPNRRQFLARLAAEIERPGGSAQPALAVLDVDHFKRINDTLGHPSGDAVLRVVARILRSNIRSIDLVGRVGGEEFALMMPNTDIAMAQAICERIRATIAAHRFGAPEGVPLKVTVSVGLAFRAPEETMSELISRADKALYQSKHDGRNRVQLAA